ncbi:MAG: hypothetical protein Q4G67_12745, partial [Actinomycetia bacterium]|nr:hypothetical protein [Actinomycetes bacterium]
MSARLLVALSSSLEARFVTTAGTCRESEVARRCADVADLLAAATAGVGTCAAVSADLPHLDLEVIGTLRRLDVGVLGVIEDGDDAGERRLRQLGLDTVISVSATAAEIDAGVLAVNAEDSARRSADGRRSAD